MPVEGLHPNVAGGIIAVLLPLQFIALWGRKERYVLLPVSAAALLLSASRGAWLALAAIGTAWFIIAAARSRRRVLEAAAAATAIALLILAVLIVPTILAQGNQPGPGPAGAAPAAATSTTYDSARASDALPAAPAPAPSTAEGRATLFGNALGLAWDYALTGLGLEGFQMAFSSYVLLLHVGHTNHAHNIFLDVWLGQGLLGLGSLIWLLATAVIALRRILQLGDQDGRAWALAAAASVAVMVLHGLVDDAFYATRGILFMFLPFAVLAREQAVALWQDENPPARFSDFLTGKGGLRTAIVLTLAMLIALLPPIRSQIQANLGALAQTRAELSIYEWPKWPVQDELRRSPEVELDRRRGPLSESPGARRSERDRKPQARPGCLLARRLCQRGPAARHCIPQWLHESSNAGALRRVVGDQWPPARSGRAVADDRHEQWTVGRTHLVV